MVYLTYLNIVSILVYWLNAKLILNYSKYLISAVLVDLNK